MISNQLLKQEDESSRTAIEIALMTLAHSGILLKQINEWQRPLMEGFSTEDEDKLTKKIVEVRNNSKVLRGLHDLGLQIAKEKS